MKNKFKLLMMVLAIILAISTVLTGCSSKEQAGSGEEESEGTVDLTMAIMDAGGNMTDLPLVQEEINKITKEKINATVTILPIGIGAWQQQTNLMMTGDEKLDLIVTSQFFNYQTQAVKGQLIPLNELIESHGGGLKEVIPSKVLEATEIEGESYGIPGIRDWASYYGFIMRKDLVEKHNIDLSQVKTFEDLTPIFQTIKDNEPTITPIVNTTVGASLSNVLHGGKFDALDSLGVVPFNEPDRVVNMFEHEMYKEAISLARDWFQAGYVLKDAATSTDTAPGIVKSGKGFGYFSHMKPGFEIQEQKMTGHEMVTVVVTEPYSYTDAGTGFMMSIPRNSKTPEKAMELINLLYTDADIMNLLTIGIEGKHYELKEDGTAGLPEGVTEATYFFNQWQVGNNFLTHPLEGNDPDVWKVMEEHNNSANISPAFGFTFNPDPVKTEIAATSNVLAQFRIGIESGTLDPEKSLPEFNEKLKAAGLDKIIAEKQKQFDEFKAKK